MIPKAVFISYYIAIGLLFFYPIPTLRTEPDGWLDTLHVVLRGQGYRPSEPKGLHTGFSGPPLIAVKGCLCYM